MFDSMTHDVLKNLTILVVDDDPNGQEVVRILLNLYGATVYLANDGEEGLAVAHATHPHFIISDLSMPVMDGWEMLKHLKADPVTRIIPVIALTAHAMSGDRDKTLKAGFHSYMTKPITPSMFIYTLLQMLAEIPELALELK